MSIPSIFRNHRRQAVQIGILALVSLSVTLTGCENSASPQLIVGPATNSNRLLMDYQKAADLGYRVDWETQAVVSDGFQLEELEVFDDIVVGREGGTILTVLDSSDGQLRWTDVLGNPLQTFVGTVRVKDRLLVSSSTELMQYKVDTGQLVAKQRLKTVVNTKPVIVGDLAIYGCANGHVLAHNWVSGFMDWAYDTYNSIKTQPIMVGNAVAVINDKGAVLVLTPDGEAIGRRKLYGNVTNTPVANEDVIFIAGNDQSIWALTRWDCKALWRYRTDSPLKQQPVLIGDTLYQDVPSEGVVALNTKNGSVIWKSPQTHGRVINQKNNRILTWDGKKIYMIDKATGRLVSDHDMPRLLDIKTDNIINGNLFLANTSGRISKLIPLR